MNINLENIYLDELRELNIAIEIFEIPANVFADCGTSYTLIAAMKHHRESVDESFHALLEDANRKFEILCNSAPRISRDTLSALSLAYGGFLFLTNNGKDMTGLLASKGDYQESIRALMEVSMMRGVAIGRSGLAEGEFLRRKILSEAGKNGAKVRRERTENLKTWAISEAKKMTGSDMEVARKLATKIPKELAGSSKNEIRFIYETIRKEKYAKPATRNG